jgi:hypothetical protein
LIGAFHGGIGYGLRQARMRSPYLALFVFAMISAELVWGQNRDPISHVRSLVWDGLWGIIIYQLLVRPLVGHVVPVRARVRRVSFQPRRALEGAPSAPDWDGQWDRSGSRA